MVEPEDRQLFPIDEISLRESRPDKVLSIVSAWVGLESIIESMLEQFNVPRNICLEFGVEFGYSTVALSNFFSLVKGVDTFIGDANTLHQGDHFDSTRKTLEPFSNIELIRSDYQDWIVWDSEKYDLIHIDIVHTYEDTYNCGLWSLDHSICTIFHDTESFLEVRKAVIDLARVTGKRAYNYPKFNGLGIIV